jgi:hypothetical protein
MKDLFTRKNIICLIISCILLIGGYILLAQGPVDNPISISFAPFILVGCYCIFIPAAIILKDKKEEK